MDMLLLLALQAEAVEALRQTRVEKCYEVAFTSSTGIGRGDPLDRKGTVRWWKAGVIIVDSTGSAEEVVRAVRAGTQFACAKHGSSFKSTPCESCGAPRQRTPLPRTWVHFLGAWTPADEVGKASVTSGFQNPDELLRLIEAHVKLAQPMKGGWVIALKGQDALNAANKLDPERKFVAQNAALSALLKLDQGRVVSMDVDATLATADGAVTFTASARLGSFGQVAVPAALGTVPFNPDVAAAITKQLR